MTLPNGEELTGEMQPYEPTTFELVKPYSCLPKIPVRDVRSNASKHGSNPKQVARRHKRKKNKKTHRK